MTTAPRARGRNGRHHLIDIKSGGREKAILAGFRTRGTSADETDEAYVELARLADTAGADAVAVVTQAETTPTPQFFVGRGKVDEIAAAVDEHEAEVVIFNHNLSPLQFKNLEEALEAKVVDRTQLILDIFAMRAASDEGKIQVELAQLTYMLPRITGKGLLLSRLGGGIGTRGPGETKLEADRRRIRARISTLKKKLEKIALHRSVQNRRRDRSGVRVVALVGYTNAGKTTLFNRLSSETAFVEDKLFATLDPLTRRVYLPGAGNILVIDTVGFIKNLPVELVESFKSTLEVARDAHLILHVTDISNPTFEEQMFEVEKILAELGAGDAPTMMVFNKTDALDKPGRLDAMLKSNPGSIAVSALKSESIDNLKEEIARRLSSQTV
ncbi:MAG: GTPase HflX [bacterium ADurb.Bin236]|nr:MAG: GTPase HflX [bacterium ADurb.Bin236]HOY61900.1 GTPase HflX [bacterium]